MELKADKLKELADQWADAEITLLEFRNNAVHLLAYASDEELSLIALRIGRGFPCT